MASMSAIIRRIIAVAALLAFAAPVLAQTLEIITLQHRSADYLIPQIQPLLPPGAAITGVGEKLFVRTPPQSLAQIRELVSALDTPVRRLMISVRSDGESTDAGAGGGLQGNVRIINGQVGAGGTASVYSSSRASRNDISSQVQTIDGGRAVLHVGQSFVVPMRQVLIGPGGAIVADTLVQRQIDSGFVATPRLAGNTVMVEISPQLETFSPQPGQPAGAIRTERLSTTVSGRVGEWMVLGGASSADSGSSGGVGHYGTGSANRQRRVLLKVDLLD